MTIRFRWVSLQLNSLSGCRSIATVKMALSSLPPTLDETYARILQQIADEEKPFVRQILQILCVAARPILLTEVAELYQIRDNIHPPFLGESILFHPEDVIDICRGLLSLAAMEGYKFNTAGLYYHPTRETSTTIIQLAHFSVKEYLFSSCSSSWMLTEEASHISIIRTCIASFLQAATTMDVPVNREYPLEKIDTLAGYFCQYLWHHLDMLHLREHPTLVLAFQVLSHLRMIIHLPLLLNSHLMMILL
jgi:hypothetical protein